MERKTLSWNNSFVRFTTPRELIPLFKTSENKNCTLLSAGCADVWNRAREEKEAEKGFRYANF